MLGLPAIFLWCLPLLPLQSPAAHLRDYWDRETSLPSPHLWSLSPGYLGPSDQIQHWTAAEWGPGSCLSSHTIASLPILLQYMKILEYCRQHFPFREQFLINVDCQTPFLIAESELAPTAQHWSKLYQKEIFFYCHIPLTLSFVFLVLPGAFLF